MRNSTRTLIAALILLALVSPAIAAAQSQHWNQWRGPSRDSHADPSTLPAELPAELTEVWSVEVGEGYAGPLVIDDTIYLFSRQEGNEILRAISLADGTTSWRLAYPVEFEPEPAARSHGPGPKSTPVYADGRIFTLGITGVLSAVDAAEGDLVWRHDFAGDFPETWPIWGASMSPIVVGDSVIAHVGGDEGGAMRAFDVATGEVAWSNDEFTPGYASPVVVEVEGTEVLVTQSNVDIIALDAAGGSTLWSMPYATSAWQNAVSPMRAGSQVVLSGLDLDIFAVELAGNGDGLEATETWRNNRVPLYMSSPVLVGDRLFGMSHKRRGQFISLDVATGEPVWTTQGREGENAVLTVLGDRVAILTDEAELIIIDASADTFEPLARYQVADTPTWTPPAFTSEGVLIKDLETLSLLSFR